MKWVLFLLVARRSILVFAEVTVLKIVQTIYDKSSRLRIRGAGFDVDEHSIILELSVSGQPSLKADEDYMITKDDDGLILKLVNGRRWVNFHDRDPSTSLVLTGVKWSTNLQKNLLIEPVIVANVLATPIIKPNNEFIYTTVTNELHINGIDFVGAKKLDLYFNPPIYKEVEYEMVSPFPLTNDEVVLRLRHGYKWRDIPGPLAIVGVDTGGGPVKLNDDRHDGVLVEGDEGVLVAIVQADLDLHGVTVETSATRQLIYHDEPNIIITGTGFNTQGNTLSWANGILGKGISYTTVATSQTSISIRIVPGSHWRKDVENLPGYLTLLAVNAGEGFVAVGPTNAAKGRDIATVFERPAIYSSNTKLYRTHSHELHIKGVGFTKVLAKTQLRFSPPLTEGLDYKINVIDRTEMEVTLLDGRRWRSDDGPLIITGINTRGDEAGWLIIGGENGVQVAEILCDSCTPLVVNDSREDTDSVKPVLGLRPKTDIRRDIVEAQNLIISLENDISDATARKDYALALKLDNKMKVIADERLSALKNELLLKAPRSILSSSDIAQLSLQSCHAKVSKRAKGPLAEGIVAAIEIIDQLLSDAAHAGVMEISFFASRLSFVHLGTTQSFQCQFPTCCPTSLWQDDEWTTMVQKYYPQWQKTNPNHWGSYSGEPAIGPYTIGSFVQPKLLAEGGTVFDACRHSDITRCKMIGESCAIGTKAIGATMKPETTYKFGRSTTLITKLQLENLILLQDTFSPEDVNIAATTMMESLGMAYLAWIYLKQGYQVQLDDIKSGVLTINLWGPSTNVTIFHEHLLEERISFDWGISSSNNATIVPETFRVLPIFEEYNQLVSSISFMEFLALHTKVQCTLT